MKRKTTLFSKILRQINLASNNPVERFTVGEVRSFSNEGHYYVEVNNKRFTLWQIVDKANNSQDVLGIGLSHTRTMGKVLTAFSKGIEAKSSK